MPPLDIRDLIAAFNASWIAGAPLGQDEAGDDVVLDCGTPAADSMIAMCNAAELAADSFERVPSPYLRIGAAPRDAALAGRSWNALLDGHVAAGLAALRAHRSATGPSSSPASANASAATPPTKSGLEVSSRALSSAKGARMRKALSEWCTLLMAQLRDPSQRASPVPALSVPGADSSPVDILSSLPTASDITARWQQQWGAASYFCRPGGPAFAGYQRHAEERTNVLRANRVAAVRVPGALEGDLAGRSLPRLPSVPARADTATAVIFTVAVYHERMLRRDQEFLVHGDQTLDALADRIYCLSDHPTCSSGYGGRGASYLYIEGVLYDDRRPGRSVVTTSGQESSERRYLSREVEEWSLDALHQGRSLGWGALRGGSMQATRFVDLRPRLGAHYLFCHQGNCQHLVVFLDARCLSPLPGYDVLDAACYPRHMLQAPYLRRRCAACKRNRARHAVFGDPFTAANPTHLCDSCHRLLHTDADGNLDLRGATVVPYVHD
jgi:hypothetical protein